MMYHCLFIPVSPVAFTFSVQEPDQFPCLFFDYLIPTQAFSRRQVGFSLQEVAFQVADGGFEAMVGEEDRVVVFFGDEVVVCFFPEGESFFVDVKVSGFEDAEMDGIECHGVHKGPELLQDVQREGGAPVGRAVEGAEVGVQSGFGEDAGDAVAEEGVVEAQQGVGAVFGGAAVAAGEFKPFCADEFSQPEEVFFRCNSFKATELFKIFRCFHLPGDDADSIDTFCDFRFLGFVVSFSQEVFAVDEFAADAGFGEVEAKFRFSEMFKLKDAKEDVFPRCGEEASPVLAVNGEEDGVDAFCEQGGDGLGRDADVTEDDQLFNVFQEYPGEGFPISGED